MICKHCYVVPKSLTKTLSNLRELERKLRFLLYSRLLLFKGHGGRGRVKGGQGQEQGGRGRERGKRKRGHGDGGARDEGSKDEGSKDEGKGSGGGAGSGGTRRKERERERQREKQEEGERGNWNGRTGTGELERDPRFIATEKNKILKKNIITTKIIFVLTRLFLVLRGASFIS